MTAPDIGSSCGQPILTLEHVYKTFGANAALSDVSLQLGVGEVLGLIGANGSGKSTLIKVMAGVYAPDTGSMRIRGRDITLPVTSAQAHALRLRFVHQDLGLIPALSALENLLLTDLATSRRSRIRWAAERHRAQELMSRYNLSFDLRTPVTELSPVQRAMLAIVRATRDVSGGARPDRRAPGAGTDGDSPILVLDEPTVFLSSDERHVLFELIRRVVADGAGVIFVSHELEEVREICDRVVILRDGHVVAARPVSQVSDGDLAELIVGKSLNRYSAEASKAVGQWSGPPGESAVAIIGLAGPHCTVTALSFRRGSIVGLTGLSGAGFEEIPGLLAGARAAQAGTLRIGNRLIGLSQITPKRAMGRGIVYVPADRQNDAIISDLSVTQNITMPVLDTFYRRGWLRTGGLTARAKSLITKFGVKAHEPALPVGSLSGGNQQRVVLGKWLQIDPMLILLSEPTQGVDVGARQDVFRILRAAADGGATVLCASSDYDQLASLCDEVIVFRGGRPSERLTGDRLTVHQILHACLGGVG